MIKFAVYIWLFVGLFFLILGIIADSLGMIIISIVYFFIGIYFIVDQYRTLKDKVNDEL